MGGSFLRLARRPRFALLAALAFVVVAVGPAGADDGLDGVLGDPGRTYPDLVPDVTEVSIAPEVLFDQATSTFYDGDPIMYFDTFSQNLGTVPVELTADDPRNITASSVSQCVSWRAPYVCREQEQVGGFTWHDEHTHFHYEDFADYELRRFTRRGLPDFSRRGLIAVSEKVSFCLIDSTAVRPDASPVRFYNVCNPVRQGISPGYADIYSADLEGQNFRLPGIADGDYALVVTMDPSNRLHESNDRNNRVVVRIRISEGARAVSIVDRSWSTSKFRRR
ncbi:MAG TPA: lysyl oxidase family protein [Acidimicrobiales bacterium]|nr:lysyl oxidase family protein [Acidimicrobiales bacterium]